MAQQEKYGRGPGGFYVCPKCGIKKPHKKGTPCKMEKRPKCGSKMIRKDPYHHRLIKEKYRSK